MYKSIKDIHTHTTKQTQEKKHIHEQIIVGIQKQTEIGTKKTQTHTHIDTHIQTNIHSQQHIKKEEQINR